ncbi:MAG: flagellar basal body-associated FliL family protein [Deltaproteobacteria bacterium]|jgi:flagellar FliL protein|nr:flagellar basal body-associated FliL family protein [Deltaproteobacteria bacterium]
MADKKPPKEAKKTAPPPEPESDSKATPAEEGGKSGKSGKLKLIIIVVAAMVVGGAGAFAASRFLGSKAPEQSAASGDEFSQTIVNERVDEEPIVAPSKSKPEGSGGGHSAAADGEAPPAPVGPITVELKPFTTNLNEPSGRRFLKVTIGMEVDDQAASDELNRMMPDIQDSVLILLSSQSVEDIGTVDGKERLRSQILLRTNSFMRDHKVKKIKYSEFIIQ